MSSRAKEKLETILFQYSNCIGGMNFYLVLKIFHYLFQYSNCIGGIQELFNENEAYECFNTPIVSVEFGMNITNPQPLVVSILQLYRWNISSTTLFVKANKFQYSNCIGGISYSHQEKHKFLCFNTPIVSVE